MSNSLLNHWSAGREVSTEEQYEAPEQPSGSALITLIGLSKTDHSHRLYTLPAATPPAEIIRYFGVSSHGAMSDSLDAEETIKRVIKHTAYIFSIAPCSITFADAAGLKINFKRPITDDEGQQIAAIFEMDHATQDGLENYMDELFSGTEEFAARLKDEGGLHLWWD